MLDRILDAIGRFSYRRRYLVAAAAVLLFAAVTVLQFFAGISYSYSDYNKVQEVFPEDDTLVIVYDNRDEDRVQAVIDYLSADAHVTSLNAYANTLGAELGPDELAETAGVDKIFIRTLFYLRENGVQTAGMTVLDFINFAASDALAGSELFSEQIDEDTKALLRQAKELMNAAASGTEYDAPALAAMLGVEEQKVRMVFLMKGASAMTAEAFVDAMAEMTKQLPTASEEQLAQLSQLQSLVLLVKSNQRLSPAELAAAFSSEVFDERTAAFVCLMKDAEAADLSGQKSSIYELFGWLTGDFMTDPAFAPYFDGEIGEKLAGAAETVEQAKAQLVGPQHSRMILTLDYEAESAELYEFCRALETELDGQFAQPYQLIGNSAMSNELSKTFRSEHLLVSIVTAAAIFVIVCITFKRFSVALLLVCIIECAVFITMSVMTVAGESMYFLALIIVQCILMGSMVDYGILLSNYYVEVRKEYPAETALPEVLKRSIRAIATSAVIMIAITFVCSLTVVGAVSIILKTLCIGSLSALILVIFGLPSLLAILDKRVVKAAKKGGRAQWKP